MALNGLLANLLSASNSPLENWRGQSSVHSWPTTRSCGLPRSVKCPEHWRRGAHGRGTRNTRQPPRSAAACRRRRVVPEHWTARMERVEERDPYPNGLRTYLRDFAATRVDEVQKNVQYVAIDGVQHHRLLLDLV